MMLIRLQIELNDIVAKTGNRKSQKLVPKRSKKVLERMRKDFERRVKRKGCDPSTPLGRYPNQDDYNARDVPTGCKGDAKGQSSNYRVTPMPKENISL